MNITRDGDRFTLVSTSGQTMTIGNAELYQLAVLAKDYADRIQQTSLRGGSGIAVTPITSAGVGVDMHHTEVNLRLRDVGFEQAYSVPLDVAKGLIIGLTKQVTLIEADAAKRGKAQ